MLSVSTAWHQPESPETSFAGSDGNQPVFACESHWESATKPNPSLTPGIKQQVLSAGNLVDKTQFCRRTATAGLVDGRKKAPSTGGRDFQPSFCAVRCHQPASPKSDFSSRLASVNQSLRNNDSPQSLKGCDEWCSTLHPGILVDEKASSLIKVQKLQPQVKPQASHQPDFPERLF